MRGEKETRGYRGGHGRTGPGEAEVEVCSAIILLATLAGGALVSRGAGVGNKKMSRRGREEEDLCDTQEIRMGGEEGVLLQRWR